MINRDNAVTEIMDRTNEGITGENLPYPDFELKHLELTPVNPVGRNQMPCVLFFEDIDTIIKRTKRDPVGFPLVRTLNLIVELWDFDTVKVKQLYLAVRKSILANGGDLGCATAIETKNIGPFTALQEGAIGMRIILDVTYIDKNL